MLVNGLDVKQTRQRNWYRRKRLKNLSARNGPTSRKIDFFYGRI